MGDVWRSFQMERSRLRPRSLVQIAAFSGLAALCAAMLAVTITSGRATWLEVVFYGGFMLLGLALVGLEVGDMAPMRLELGQRSVTLLVRGRPVRRIDFDATVKAEVRVGPGGGEQKVDPYRNSCCSGDEGEVTVVPMKPFTGYSFSRGDEKIECSLEQGWALEDLMEMWPPFLEAVRAHGMAMGEELSGFLSSVERLPVDLPPAPEDYGRPFWEMSVEDFIDDTGP